MQVLIELKGTTPLIQHNARMVDSADEFTRLIADITAKKKKTAADYEEIAHLEFLGGLYYDPDIGVHIPTWNIIRAFEDGGKISRQGTAIVRAVAASTDRVKLEYDGPRKPEELWQIPSFRFRKAVGVNRNRVIRVRPQFRKWALTLQADILDDVIDLDDFSRIVEIAGRAVGIGDARKLGYGRFTATIVEAGP